MDSYDVRSWDIKKLGNGTPSKPATARAPGQAS
jgi:hypothetical protein